MERAVFSDPSGHRWRRIKIGALVAMFATGAGLSIAYANVHPLPDPSVAANRHLRETSTINPATVKNPVSIGSGPLVRVLRVRDGTGYDPYTGKKLYTLTSAEVRQLHGSGWAVQQYGFPADKTHLMSLTFDDGPDPKWTPEILNVLAKEKVHATFFLIGHNVKLNPQLVVDEVNGGHAIGNHTLTHPDLDTVSAAEQTRQLVTTDRIIRSAGHIATNFWRAPYTSSYSGDLVNQIPEIMRSQRLGYTFANYTYDTDDWKAEAAGLPASSIAMPKLDGRNYTLLMHDAGGKTRAQTVQYVSTLIRTAKANGYTFMRMPQVSLGMANTYAPPSLWDRLTLSAPTMTVILWVLFAMAVFGFMLQGLLHVCLAIWRRLHRKPVEAVDFNDMPVTIAVAAYNEEKVIGATINSLGRSLYEDLEILVVDDGSTDSTAEVVRRKMKLDPRIRLISKKNGGKSTALNMAFAEAKGEVIATFDADGIVDPDTVPNLVRPFITDPNLGATAGAISVGNARNLLTRWQRLEYTCQVGVDRAAGEVLNSIMVVPGAAGAWRKSAVLAVGGYSADTLAEDADLCLTLQRAGYRVAQVDAALCYTEAPETFKPLLMQRRRWLLGQFQCLWKHRGMMFDPNHGWLGMFYLPVTLFGIAVPILTQPFLWLMMGVAIYNHGFSPLLPSFMIFVGIQALIAIVSITLMKRGPSTLIGMGFDLLAYPPLRAYLLYRTSYSALSGRLMGWNKLQRTGNVTVPEPRYARAPEQAYVVD